MRAKSLLAIAFLLSVWSPPLAFAKVPEEEAERLGDDLTPLGAVDDGEGDVPAWTGGLKGVPARVKFDPKKEHPPNPFPDDEIKYAITPENMGAYDALLTDGHKAMLRRVPDFKMNVYRSRRSCTVPKFVQEATRRNAIEAELTADGEGVTGGRMGTPFPIPQSAKEVMWNHRLRYQPHMLTRHLANAVVKTNGEVKLIRAVDQMRSNWAAPPAKIAPTYENDLRAADSTFYLLYQRAFIDPWGEVFLAHESINAAVAPRKLWAYSPGTRRVRRAPDIAYDGPGFGAQGMATADAALGFDGPLDRYDWSIQLRSVKVVPYNAYLIVDSTYATLLEAKRLNPNLTRYEPHRVWTVEAKLRQGLKHIYERRVLHVDEDAWAVVAGELYDGRGELWRVQEVHTANFYDVPVCLPVADVTYDTQSDGAYYAGSLINEEQPLKLDLQDKHLLPETIRTTGR